jgi:hypothetical protein
VEDRRADRAARLAGDRAASLHSRLAGAPPIALGGVVLSS